MTAMSTATKEKLYISTSAVSAVDKRQKFCYNRIVANEERCPSGLWSWSRKPVMPQGTGGSNPSLSASFLTVY